MPKTLNREEVIETLCRLAAEQVSSDPAGVTLDTDFYTDLNYDSLNLVEYVMEIEEEFDLTIPDQQTEGVRTVGQVLERLWPMLR
jgi:acyl carrier protein